MKLKDARHLPAQAQEALRYRAVHAIKNGMSKSEAARVFQVSRTAIHNWTKAVDEHGAKALQAKQRGRRHSSRLAPHEAATTVRLLTQKCPDQLVSNSAYFATGFEQFATQRKRSKGV